MHIGTQFMAKPNQAKKIRQNVTLGKSRGGYKSRPMYVEKQTAGINIGKKVIEAIISAIAVPYLPKALTSSTRFS